MNRKLAVPAATVLALALAVPALAGGDNCRHGSQAGATAASKSSCYDGAKSAAWAGAWLQRTPTGGVTVAEVAKGSPAARAGLKPGDLVLAVNGYDLSNSAERAMCASKAECTVGKTVVYTVQRHNSTKDVKLKLEKMPADAMGRFASRQATFDPVLAAEVIPAVN